jgi:hypothetical protein
MISTDARKIRYWSIAGFWVIVILGSLYHFMYDWFGKSVFIASFFPVNESVWEHLKLGLWAVITYSFVEYLAMGKRMNNYFFSKAVAVLIISFTILIIFYSYTYFIENSIVWVDISSYIAGAFLGQIISRKIVHLKHSKSMNVLGIIMIVVFCVTFAILTFYPPHAEIFRDHNYDAYGIIKDAEIN